MPDYEVVLGPAAKVFVLNANLERRLSLAECLKSELEDGPNAHAAYWFEIERVTYTAMPLSCNGVVAVYRPLTDSELQAIRRKRSRGRKTANAGFFVIDFLPPTSAIYLRVPVSA